MCTTQHQVERLQRKVLHVPLWGVVQEWCVVHVPLWGVVQEWCVVHVPGMWAK